MGSMGRLFPILFLLLPVSGMTVGCAATPSGQALQAWLGGSLDRLREATDPRRLVNPEIRRARNLIAKAPGYPNRAFRRTTPLARGAMREASSVWARTQRLPRRAATTVDRDVTSMRRRVRHVIEPDSLLRQTLDPGRHARALRRICRRLPTVLGLDRPILSAPGDPDRQTGAHPTRSQRTWVEKILRRVRL